MKIKAEVRAILLQTRERHRRPANQQELRERPAGSVPPALTVPTP